MPKQSIPPSLPQLIGISPSGVRWVAYSEEDAVSMLKTLKSLVKKFKKGQLARKGGNIKRGQ